MDVEEGVKGIGGQAVGCLKIKDPRIVPGCVLALLWLLVLVMVFASGLRVTGVAIAYAIFDILLDSINDHTSRICNGGVFVSFLELKFGYGLCRFLMSACATLTIGFMTFVVGRLELKELGSQVNSGEPIWGAVAGFLFCFTVLTAIFLHGLHCGNVKTGGFKHAKGTESRFSVGPKFRFWTVLAFSCLSILTVLRLIHPGANGSLFAARWQVSNFIGEMTSGHPQFLKFDIEGFGITSMLTSWKKFTNKFAWVILLMLYIDTITNFIPERELQTSDLERLCKESTRCYGNAGNPRTILFAEHTTPNEVIYDLYRGENSAYPGPECDINNFCMAWWQKNVNNLDNRDHCSITTNGKVQSEQTALVEEDAEKCWDKFQAVNRSCIILNEALYNATFSTGDNPRLTCDLQSGVVVEWKLIDLCIKGFITSFAMWYLSRQPEPDSDSNEELAQRNAGAMQDAAAWSHPTPVPAQQPMAPPQAQRAAPPLNQPMAPPFRAQPVPHGSQPQLAHPNQIGAFPQQQFGASFGGQQQFGASFGAQHMMPGGAGLMR